MSLSIYIYIYIYMCMSLCRSSFSEAPRADPTAVADRLGEEQLHVECVIFIYIYIYIYIYVERERAYHIPTICVYVYLYIYIYTHIEREREAWKTRAGQADGVVVLAATNRREALRRKINIITVLYTYVCIHIYIYIYNRIIILQHNVCSVAASQKVSPVE